jgi:hypothetical protein
MEPGDGKGKPHHALDLRTDHSTRDCLAYYDFITNAQSDRHIITWDHDRCSARAPPLQQEKKVLRFLIGQYQKCEGSAQLTA